MPFYKVKLVEFLLDALLKLPQWQQDLIIGALVGVLIFIFVLLA